MGMPNAGERPTGAGLARGRGILSCEKRLNAGLVGPYRRGLGRGPSVRWAWLEPALGPTVGFK